MSNDPVADLIIRLKNASAVNKPVTTIPYSNLKFAIAERLAATGYVKGVSIKGKLPHKLLEVELAYRDGAPRIAGFSRISKLSRRVYQPAKRLYPFRQGFGEMFVSTSRGIMTSREARRSGVGGEVLFTIW